MNSLRKQLKELTVVQISDIIGFTVKIGNHNV